MSGPRNALLLGVTALGLGCASPVTKPYRPNPPSTAAPRTNLRVAVAQQVSGRGKESFGLAFLGPAFTPGWVAMKGSAYASGDSTVDTASSMVAQELAASQMFSNVEAKTWNEIRENPDAFDLLIVVRVASDRRNMVMWPSAGGSLPGFMVMLCLGLVGVPGGTIKRWLDVDLEARPMLEPTRVVWSHHMRVDSRRRVLFMIPAYQRPRGALHSETYDAETPELYREGLLEARESLSLALREDIPRAIADAANRPRLDPMPPPEEAQTEQDASDSDEPSADEEMPASPAPGASTDTEPPTAEDATEGGEEEP